MTWREGAKCGGMDSSRADLLFFPHKPNSQANRRAKNPKIHGAEAKEYCGDCPVRLACLQEALDGLASFDGWHKRSPYFYGVWGGTTPDERMALLERKAA